MTEDMSDEGAGGRDGRSAPAAGRHDPPAWFDELRSALVYADHVVLFGNTRDIFPMNSNRPGDGPSWAFLPLEPTLWHLLTQFGVRVLLCHDPLNGLQPFGRIEPALELSLANAGLAAATADGSLPALAAAYGALARFQDVPAALLVSDASRLHGRSAREREDFFVSVDRATRARSAGDAPIVPGPPAIWVVDHPADLPDWFVLGNDALREVQVELPNLEDRFLFARHMAGAVGLASDRLSGEEGRLLQEFALDCEGETLVAMGSILKVARAGGIDIAHLLDAVRTYRTGIRRNPWTSPVLHDRIREARTILDARVRGQPHAVDKTLDILARSIMGLSGIQSGARHTRPRGVLFFVGPTGVGKTEMAKAVTELLFGDETACHRFDMSEFMEESSVSRLIGAPPGHPGHERGGELINAAHRRPFSVFLFDEIEKAHPRVLDIFLQILDEGRLTDSRGATAHFSEALIVFTSNIGITQGARETNMGMTVLPSDSHAQLEVKIGRAVQDHFRIDLQRPELVNRIGQNIVVFDFLTPASVAQIFDAIVARVLDTVQAEHGTAVALSATARDDLKTLCTSDYFDGGRGVGNRIETHLINPLSRAMFDMGPCATIAIDAVVEEDGKTRLVLREAASSRGSDPQAKPSMQARPAAWPHRVTLPRDHVAQQRRPVIRSDRR